MDGDICEGNLPCIKKPHDHHPRDPERDDVTAGDERGRGIEAVELRRLRRPAERGVRPERRGEPGVERVGIADERFSIDGICAKRLVRRADMPAAAAVGLPRHGLPACERHLKIGIRHALDVPDRNPVAPPELPAHRPVAFFTKPVEIALGVAVGHDANLSLRDGIQRRLRDLAHADEPLIGQERLDRCLRPVGVGEVDDAILHLHELAGCLEIGHHPRAGLHHHEAGVGARLGVERALGLQDVDHRQLLPQADVVVVGIVGRRDLHAAGAHLGLRPLVGDERNRSAEQRKPHLPTVLRHRRQSFEHRQ